MFVSIHHISMHFSTNTSRICFFSISHRVETTSRKAFTYILFRLIQTRTVQIYTHVQNSFTILLVLIRENPVLNEQQKKWIVFGSFYCHIRRLNKPFGDRQICPLCLHILQKYKHWFLQRRIGMVFAIFFGSFFSKLIHFNRRICTTCSRKHKSSCYFCTLQTIKVRSFLQKEFPNFWTVIFLVPKVQHSIPGHKLNWKSS